MNNEELYTTIFKRKSIRKFDMTPLPAAVLEDLQIFAGQVKSLDDSIRYKCVYLTNSEIKNLLPLNAPHYICLYSENRSSYLMNAGFILQQIDLYLSANGIGSCWLGLAKPSKMVMEPKGDLEFVIMIAFGNTNEIVHRSDTSVFIRKGLSAIAQIEGAEEILEPVRLAPSASNSQPWYFSGNLQTIDVSRERPGFLKAPIYERMNQIDIGIALCHLWLSLLHHGKNAVISFPDAIPPEGHEYMARVTVEDIK